MRARVCLRLCRIFACSQVAQSDEFVTYPVELLVPLLSSDLLNVSCEEQVLTAVRRWLEYTDCNSPSLVARSANTVVQRVLKLPPASIPFL